MANSKVRLLLLPLSWLYGIGTGFRNILFNAGLLPVKSYGMPILSIGNITVGGTGKTPHTEYLIEALSREFQVGVLSRGYKRKTKGFFLADEHTPWSEIGDEPRQMKNKFPSIVMAVDSNRRRGIEQLMLPSTKPFVEVLLLDDAFQHRYVNPSISILLIDYNRLIKKDFLLPAGNLRESPHQMKRAQIVVVTKCPEHLKPMDIRILSKEIDILPYQTLYFTTLRYAPLRKLVETDIHAPVSETLEGPTEEGADWSEPIGTRVPEAHSTLTMEEVKEKRLPVLLLTGIAAPEPLKERFEEFSPDVRTLIFPDHHEFGKRDARRIKQVFEPIREAGGIILTTEKDGVRILDNPWMELLKPFIYYEPLQVHFLEEQGKTFEQKILDYVRINQRNRHMA